MRCTINLIEAIKSGKRFRRPSWTSDMIAEKREGYNTFQFEYWDLIADDWFIVEPTVTITAKQFWDAAKKIYPMTDSKFDSWAFQKLAKELGLG